jgi:hypothetical protein
VKLRIAKRQHEAGGYALCLQLVSLSISAISEAFNSAPKLKQRRSPQQQSLKIRLHLFTRC